ncbi:MAG: PA14 domain-containing protein, partial [Planctomycetota bacterium]
NPLPADGALYSDTWASLGWDAGETAVTHDVYISDNLDDVTNGAAAAFRGNQALAFFLAGLGLPGDPYPSGCFSPTIFGSKADEVEANGTTKYAGPVWSFTIPPRTAYNPLPPDGAYFTALTTKLTWTAGFGAKLHYVYFGAKFEDVNNATTGGIPLGTTTFTPPGPLVLNKTYYWRVDEFDALATYKGKVWSFATTIPGLGTAIAERWNNISGTNLSALKSDPRFPNNPDVTETVTQFAWDGPATDNYGGRIEGWVYVPATGDYTFWLATDDQGELWLSTDDDSSNTKLIASVSGWASLNQWTKYASQKSAPIPLVGGEKYYIMALWKEGGGGDHCQVAWQGPGIPTLTIIPGANISPYRPLSAYGAKPANGATSVSQTPVLQWKPGLAAASHELYFGTDADAVKNATKTSPEYKGTRTRGSESYAATSLGWQTTY